MNLETSQNKRLQRQYKNNCIGTTKKNCILKVKFICKWIKIKYLYINLIKILLDHYSYNCKLLSREIKDLNK